MATTDDKAVLVDTNVLLSATAPLRSLHRAALIVLNEWPNQGIVLAASTQVLREYLAVATRPIQVNGLGLDPGDALANVTTFRQRMRLLADSEAVWDRLRALIEGHACSGKQVHDANVVATALVAGVPKLVTANVGDFARFRSEIDVIDLAELAGR
jgi:predicted nucleic acid-binding protein